MSKSKDKSRFKPSRDDGLIQLDILSCIKNWKLKSKKIKMENLISTNRKPSIFITISSDEEYEDNIPVRKPVHRKVYFPLSDDEDDTGNVNKHKKSKEVLNPQPNGNHLSTSSKTPDLCKSTSIKIIQNKVIRSGDKIKGNSENSSSCKKTQMYSKNEENKILETNTSSSNKNTTSPGTSSTSPKSPKIIAKPEKKQININFLKVMNELISRISESRYLSNILNEEETNILKVVTTSREEYQYACFKLLMWLPKWYNLFNFCEKIDCNLSDMEVIGLFNMMKQNNIIETDWNREELIVLLKILSKQQVQDICTNLRLPKINKKDMMDSLIKYCNQQKTLTFCKSSKEIVMEQIKKKLGKYVVKIKDTYQNAFHHAYLLSTFTNPHLHDKTQYIWIMESSDFPEYTVQDHIVFYTRKDFVDYANACLFYEDFEKLSASKDHHRIFQMGNDIITILKSLQEDDRFQTAPHLKRYTALAVYTRLLSKISNSLKIQKYTNDVESWLKYLIKSFPKSHNLGNWFHDLSVLTLLQQKNPETAAKYVIQALTEKKNYLTEVQIQTLSEKGEQLKNKLKNKNQHHHDLLVEILSDLVNLDDFPQTTIDAQTIRGKKLIDKRLCDLAENWSDEKTIKFVTTNWTNYSHIAGLCEVNGIIPDKKMLDIIVSCVGRKILSGIYGRLVKDLKQYKSGMPDLLVWNEQEKKAKFVEVKGENDKLSVKQKLWLNYLKSIGANIEVCHVHSIGSKKKFTPKPVQPKTTSTASSAGPSKPQSADGDISSDFETPPASPLPKKSSSNIKKGKSLISSTPVKKGSSRSSKSFTSSPNKRKLVTQKSVEDTYKKSKTAARTETTKEKEAVVEQQNANVTLTSSEKDKDCLNTTASKMTQTNISTVAYKNKENLMVLKGINQRL